MAETRTAVAVMWLLHPLATSLGPSVISSLNDCDHCVVKIASDVLRLANDWMVDLSDTKSILGLVAADIMYHAFNCCCRWTFSVGSDFLEEAVSRDWQDTAPAFLSAICHRRFLVASIPGPYELCVLFKMASPRRDMIYNVSYRLVSTAIHKGWVRFVTNGERCRSDVFHDLWPSMLQWTGMSFRCIRVPVFLMVKRGVVFFVYFSPCCCVGRFRSMNLFSSTADFRWPPCKLNRNWAWRARSSRVFSWSPTYKWRCGCCRRCLQQENIAVSARYKRHQIVGWEPISFGSNPTALMSLI